MEKSFESNISKENIKQIKILIIIRINISLMVKSEKNIVIFGH